MRHSIHAIRTATFLAAMGLAAAALAQDAPGSASSIHTDPFTGEVVSTTSSVANPDGSHTVTTRDASGNVLDQSTVSTDPETGDRTATEVNPDGELAATDEPESFDWVEFEEWGDEDSDPDSNETEAPADTAGSGYSDEADHHAGDDPDRQPSDLEVLLDELLELEDERHDLEREHNDLLDEAATTEDPDERQEIVKKAGKVWEKMENLDEKYFDKRFEAMKLGGTFGPIQGDGLPPFEPDENIEDDAHPEDTADSRAEELRAAEAAAAASSNAARNAVSAAANAGALRATQGVTHMPTNVAPPRVETPRPTVTITAGPSR
jgi:hypothetical protein